MADFESAVTKTILNEGGDKYTETEGDHGGATKYGISFRFINDLLIRIESNKLHLLPLCIREALTGTKSISIDIIKNLSLNDAKIIYKNFFWDANRYEEINDSGGTEDQKIVEKLFDMAVLMGAPQANKILQKTLAISYPMSDFKIDGIIGDKTIQLVNRVISMGNFNMFAMKCLLSQYYLAICNKDKTQDDNLKGWLNRVMS